MNCPNCDNKLKLLDTRPTNDELVRRRRYQCFNCGKRFTTYEIFKEDIKDKTVALVAQRIERLTSNQ